MTLNDWINNLLPLNKNIEWKKTLNDSSSPFRYLSTDRLANLLDQLTKVDKISENLSKYLPVLLKCGNPCIALTQLIDFNKEYLLNTRRDFNWDHPNVNSFLYIFGRSNFLASRLKSNPKLADQLLYSHFLQKQKSLEVMQLELLKRIEDQGDLSLNEFKNTLRIYKYEEYLRITVRDLAQICSLKETLYELSSLAVCNLRTILSAITRYEFGIKKFLINQNNIFDKRISEDFFKTSRDLQQSQFLPFMILGMGKLGGFELNYSSDVDLIFIHDNEPLTGDLELDYKLRIKSAKILIDVMTDLSEEGFLARVDMRLRPGGDRAPLVQSIDEIEYYYSASGELWERLALIKANPVAGIVKLGKDFMSMISPFVYRSLLDETVIQDVEKVKKRIETEHLKESFLNVKLGVGGIREIEFFVQTFQLLYGGGKTELRNTSTMEVLEELEKLELIPQRDAYILTKAYLFLRRVEHHLQLRDEQQTHTLPSEIENQQQIARNLGYIELDIEKARQQFLSDLKDMMGSVRAIFSGLFSRKHLEIEAAIINSSKIKNFSIEEQQFIELLSQHLAPLLSDSTKNKFQRLFESVNVRINYYNNLSKHPSSISRLMRIAETSEMLWNYLLNHLDLLEELNNSKIEISYESLGSQLEERLLKCENNEEDEIDQLRQFKHKITFLLGSAEMEGVLSYENTRIGLSTLAEVIVQASLQLSQKWLSHLYGKIKNKYGESGQFAIIAVGKLGGTELTYFSDLDMIFVHSGEGSTGTKSSIGAQEYWIKLIQRLISCLSTITRTGYAYKLDTRLRPSGNAGVLVSPLDIYLKYHEKSQPWEHQALIKGRVIGGIGDEKWFKKVENGIRRAVYEWIPPKDMNTQINHFRMRKEHELSGEKENLKNIKEGKGGLLDIEYLTQAFQLNFGRDFPQLRCPKTMDALKELGELNLLRKDQVEILLYNYKLLRLIENGLRLIYDESTDLLDFENINTETILKILKHHGYEVFNLRETVEEATKSVRSIYIQYF